MTIQAGSYGFRLAFQVQADLTGVSALRVDIRRPDGSLLHREGGDVSVDDAASGALSFEVMK